MSCDNPKQTPVAWAQSDNTIASDNENDKKQAVLAPLPLEWTQMGSTIDDPSPVDIIRYPWEVMEISSDPEETHITIVGTAGQKITRMGFNLKDYVSPNLTHLVFRSHLIKEMEGLAGMNHLELLELYDNMIDELKDLDGGEGGLPGVGLRVLDISYNVIRDMTPISLCPNLTELCECFLENSSNSIFSGLMNVMYFIFNFLSSRYRTK